LTRAIARPISILVDGDDSAPTVAEARARFFRDNGFGPGGGYEDGWAEAEFGQLRYRVPNSEARAAALRVHDLHHVATGYPTDWRGEAEISAWELGGRLGLSYPYAWITVLFGVFSGIVAHLRPTFRAFVRGRRSKNLYRERFDADWLRLRVADLRRELSVDGAARRPTLGDLLAFGFWGVVALGFGVVAVPFVCAMVALAAMRRLSGGRCPLCAVAS
jgi:hypothetical protein